jgi:hypothetical protein
MPNIDRTMKIISDRLHFILGSDARIIMGKDEKALLWLWREKWSEVAPHDLSFVQLRQVTKNLNRDGMSSTPPTGSSTSSAKPSIGRNHGWPPRCMSRSRKPARCSS